MDNEGGCDVRILEPQVQQSPATNVRDQRRPKAADAVAMLLLSHTRIDDPWQPVLNKHLS